MVNSLNKSCFNLNNADDVHCKCQCNNFLFHYTKRIYRIPFYSVLTERSMMLIGDELFFLYFQSCTRRIVQEVLFVHTYNDDDVNHSDISDTSHIPLHLCNPTS